MTGVPDRGTSAPRRSLEAVLALSVVLILGLAFRLIIAYVLLPGSGFGSDRASFQAWGNDLAAHGPFGFYERGFFIDYTPGYLYVLWLLGVIGNAFGGLGELIKLPAILADVALAWLVHSFVLELGGSRRAALLGAILILVNPVTWFDSAIWGQVDSVGVIFLLLGVRDLWRDRPERASFFAVVAAIVKPQLGILIPILAVVLLRRHLIDWLRPPAPTEADDDPSAELPAGPHGEPWLTRLGEGPIRLVTSAIVGFGTAILLCVPFGLSLVGLFNVVAKAAGGYPYVSVNAYNPWALLSKDGYGLAENGFYNAVRDVDGAKAGETATLIGGIPALYVGTALLLIAIIAVCAIVALYPRRSTITLPEAPGGPVRALLDDRRLLVVALTFLAVAFFILPTRVHERYLFPAFAVGAILAATSFRWRIAYVVLALASFANLYAILLTPFFKNPGVTDWLGMGEAIRSPLGVTIVVAVHVAVFVWIATELRHRAIRRLDEEALTDALWERAEGSTEPTLTEQVGPGLAAGPATPAVADTPLGAGAALGVAEGLRPPAAAGGSTLPLPTAPVMAQSWEAPLDEPGSTGLPLPFGLGRIRNLMPDRSGRLIGEGGGRFDRLDLWLLVVIVVAALVLRTFRLSEPYRMHFDEVYHARTATEFLQDWRYGMPHSIYEYTHPHLAKYAMAVGLIAAGDDRVTAQRELGFDVRDILVEPEWLDPSRSGGRAGDRFYAVGADQLRAYDLGTRELVATWSIPGGATLALDPDGHRLLVGTDDGQILAIDTSQELDDLRASPGGRSPTEPEPAPGSLAEVGGPVTRIALTDDGSGLAAATADGQVVVIDPNTGDELARNRFDGLADLADGGMGQGLTADTTAVADPSSAAAALAGITGGDAAGYQQALSSTAPDPSRVVILPTVESEQRDAIEAAISDGSLEGFALTALPLIAVSEATGVTFISPTTAAVVDSVGLDSAARGMAKVTGIDKPTLYVTLEGDRVAVVQLGESDGTARPHLDKTFDMPGDVRRVLFDEPTGMVHVLGRTPDGSADTIYVVEPHDNSVYADARLPFTAQAWALDANGDHPSGDRQAILVASADGTLASVDAGDHAFAWRLPGVIAGALMAGLIFLLVRILFRRREVAVIASILVLVDGMLFVQSRIGMNDVYVGLFIVAAYTLFAPIWTGRWRSPWAFWIVLPLVGILLGLGLASKWIALYAIAGVAVLILGRSALGRIGLILGLVLGTTVLGYMALFVPSSGATAGANYVFVVMMIALTLGAVLVTVLHPIAWSPEEIRLAIVGPAVLGIVVFLVAVPLGKATTSYQLGSLSINPVEVSLALVLGSVGVWALLRFAGMWGLGPLAPLPRPDDPVRLTEPGRPPPEGWLRPGAMLGLPIVWAVICLGAIPIAVYVASYLPWAALGNQLIGTCAPGTSCQTLVDLTKSMYEYHNGLRATHAASSPYWAWPFDLKPVWFYQDGFAAGTSAAIYDAGNLIAWWLSIPAMAFVAWQAFARRSLALGLVFVAFAFQWMPWARIDRATFQYHYYAAIPFLLIALAYFIAELRNGPSARTWALARVAAAAAILGPALMWLFKGPLCSFVRVTAVNPGSEACVATAPGQIVLTWRSAGLAAVLLGVGIVLVVQILRLGAPERESGDSDRRIRWIALTAGVGVVGLLLVGAVLPDTAIVNQVGFRIEPIALVVLVALAPVAWVVASARDPRRFAAGAVLACVIWFVVWYPNLSALPLPSTIVNAYQGLVPTYLYAFQFPVNTDPVPSGFNLMAPIWSGGAVPAGPTLFVFLLITCVIVGYAAWTWRIAAAEQAAARRDPGSIASAGDAA